MYSETGGPEKEDIDDLFSWALLRRNDKRGEQTTKSVLKTLRVQSAWRIFTLCRESEGHEGHKEEKR